MTGGRRSYALALSCVAQFRVLLDVSIVNPSIKKALDF